MDEIIADDGCRIRFDVSGAGPTILLIPGLGGAASFWSTIVPLLSNDFQVVAVDHRGAGRSDRPDGPYRVAQIASDTVAILGKLGASRAHIVGHSTGGVVAQSIAIDLPQMVESLVISGSWDRPDARFRQLFQARLEILLQAGPATYQRLTHALGFPAEWLEHETQALERAVDGAQAKLEPIPVSVSRIRMLLEHDRSDEIDRIASPTLVIGATDDAIVPFYYSERLAASIRNARLERTLGGHFFPQVDPKDFAQRLRSFLKEGSCPQAN